MFKSIGERKLPMLLAATVACGSIVASSALAGHDSGTVDHYRAHLDPVPHAPSADGGSNVTGTAKLLVRDENRLRVNLKASGLTPGLPHAMHIHGEEAAGELATCPGANRRNDLVDDGLIETVEGLEDYGPIQVSFTTRGDTSPDSGLALERFVTADANGDVQYKRSFEIPRRFAERLDELHIVVHGADLDEDGVYGGRTTALGALLEAELPVTCGEIATNHGG